MSMTLKVQKIYNK